MLLEPETSMLTVGLQSRVLPPSGCYPFSLQYQTRAIIAIQHPAMYGQALPRGPTSPSSVMGNPPVIAELIIEMKPINGRPSRFPQIPSQPLHATTHRRTRPRK